MTDPPVVSDVDEVVKTASDLSYRWSLNLNKQNLLGLNYFRMLRIMIGEKEGKTCGFWQFSWVGAFWLPSAGRWACWQFFSFPSFGLFACHSACCSWRSRRPVPCCVLFCFFRRAYWKV